MGLIDIYNGNITPDTTNISDWINLACVVIASGVAVYGVNSWRRESKWKKKAELKEEITVLLYELIDVIRDIRSPLVYNGEGDSLKSKDDKFHNLAVVRERYLKNKELFAKLQSKKYRSMALLGKDSEKIFKIVNQIVNEIFISARRLDTHYYPKFGIEEMPNQEVFDKFRQDMEKHEQIVFWQGEDDSHEKKTNQVIEAFINTINTLL